MPERASCVVLLRLLAQVIIRRTASGGGGQGTARDVMAPLANDGACPLSVPRRPAEIGWLNLGQHCGALARASGRPDPTPIRRGVSRSRRSKKMEKKRQKARMRKRRAMGVSRAELIDENCQVRDGLELVGRTGSFTSTGRAACACAFPDSPDLPGTAKTSRPDPARTRPAIGPAPHPPSCRSIPVVTPWCLRNQSPHACTPGHPLSLPALFSSFSCSFQTPIPSSPTLHHRLHPSPHPKCSPLGCLAPSPAWA